MTGSQGFRAIALAAFGLSLQGCASPGQPVTQTVRIETPGCAQVTCELSNDQGQWQLPRTPGTVTLTTSHAPLKVTCRADEGVQGSAGTPSMLGPVTGAGPVAGGVVGGAAVGAAAGATALSFIPPLGVVVVLSGVAIGAATGQAVESGRRAIRYPDLISMPMACGASAASPLPAGAALGLEIRGLQAAQAREAGVGERGAVLVTAVAAGGRAASAGLRSGDILLAADGHDLRDAADLEERVLALPPGMALSLRVWRNGQILKLVLARPPASP